MAGVRHAEQRSFFTAKRVVVRPSASCFPGVGGKGRKHWWNKEALSLWRRRWESSNGRNLAMASEEASKVAVLTGGGDW